MKFKNVINSTVFLCVGVVYAHIQAAQYQPSLIPIKIINESRHAIVRVVFTYANTGGSIADVTLSPDVMKASVMWQPTTQTRQVYPITMTTLVPLVPLNIRVFGVGYIGKYAQETVATPSMLLTAVVDAQKLATIASIEVTESSMIAVTRTGTREILSSAQPFSGSVLEVTPVVDVSVYQPDRPSSRGALSMPVQDQPAGLMPHQQQLPEVIRGMVTRPTMPSSKLFKHAVPQVGRLPIPVQQQTAVRPPIFQQVAPQASYTPVPVQQPAIQQVVQSSIFQRNYPEAYGLLEKNLAQMKNGREAVDILIRPLPHVFNQYQDIYYKILSDNILAHFNHSYTSSYVSPRVGSCWMSLWGAIGIGLGIRFAVFAKVLGIDDAEIMPEYAKQIVFGSEEDGSFIISNQATVDQLYEGRDFEIITNLYKIHLNPSDEHLDYIVFKLLGLKAHNAGFFGENHLAFKLKLAQENERQPREVPFVIVYMRNKQFAQVALDFLYEQFKNDKNMGCPWVPGFNEQATDLIFFAQGDRDNKISLKNSGDIAKFFQEPDFVYYKTGLTHDPITGLPADYRLNNPARR
jgi:hypothetical protein